MKGSKTAFVIAWLLTLLFAALVIHGFATAEPEDECLSSEAACAPAL